MSIAANLKNEIESTNSCYLISIFNPTILRFCCVYFYQTPLKSIRNTAAIERADNSCIHRERIAFFNIWNYCRFYGNNFFFFAFSSATFKFPLMKKSIVNNGMWYFFFCSAIGVLKFATLNDLFVVCMVVFCCYTLLDFCSPHLSQPAIVTMCCWGSRDRARLTISRNNEKPSQSHLTCFFFVYLLTFSLVSLFILSSRSLFQRPILFLWSHSDRLQIDLRQAHNMFFFLYSHCILCPRKKKHDLLYSKWLVPDAI